MSEEEKKAIEYWKRDKSLYHYNTQLCSEHYAQIILNLIDNQQKEISLLKDQLEYVKSEYEETIEQQSKEIEELKKENKEIRDWKYVIDNPIDLKKLSKLNIIKIFGKSYIAKDKIIAKVIELKDRPVVDEFITATQGKLNTIIDIESLLDEEE